MSFNVYFEKEGGMWVHDVEDLEHTKFNFVPVDNEEHYKSIVGLQANQSDDSDGSSNLPHNT
jgi:hypothetical protein